MTAYSKVIILDGYTDEPAGFGVPPYIDTLPRYIAGAIWSVDKTIKIRYYVVDEVRRDPQKFIREANETDLVILIAGAVVPGRYIGGTPITFREIESWFSLIEKPVKILVGAAARWGFGNRGGSIATLPTKLRALFTEIVKGDPEEYVYNLVKDGIERASPYSLIEDMKLVSKFAVKGASIVLQHPNYGYNLVAEIETYRGCPRWITGGCSFCVTPLYGKPRQREAKDIVREVEALYKLGVRHFRIGRQADILVYGSKELGLEEWPRPEPPAIEKLFHGIRTVAPSLKTLHIDNVNPGTIARHPNESIEVLKIIIKYHTPGDVAALGIESVDPNVVDKNNLKVYYDDAVKAVELINKVGRERGYNGLPELLPGINFVLGLIGETRDTYMANKRFLEEIYNRNLLVRRINVREVLVLPYTRMSRVGLSFLKRNKHYVSAFKRIALDYSLKFLKRIVPPGSILKYLYVEYYDRRLGVTFARQAGSYPIIVELPCRLDPPTLIDVVVYGYSARSLRGLPIPLDANRTPLTMLAKIIGTKALIIARNRPFKSNSELYKIVPEAKGLLSIRGYSCV
ncbi:MAG: radical SAM protein [Pyrodictiaceae archaeon]